MNVIITMAGKSKRFVDKGYKIPKHLIELNGLKVIEHLINLFPFTSTKFYFVIRNNNNHSSYLKKIVSKYKLNYEIFSIRPNNLGPVYSISKIIDKLPDNDPL